MAGIQRTAAQLASLIGQRVLPVNRQDAASFNIRLVSQKICIVQYVCAQLDPNMQDSLITETSLPETVWLFA